MAASELTGGCLCGAVRYRALGEPNWASYCHCASCRRATGAPVTAYAGFSPAAFAYVAGEPTSFESSPGVTRSFCPRCGTPLTYRSVRGPHEVELHLGTLDEPERIRPQRHSFAEEKLAWLHLADQAPV